MSRRSRAAKRLLIAPVLLFAAIIALLHLVPTRDDTVDPTITDVTDDTGTVAGPVFACEREDGIGLRPRRPLARTGRVSSAMLTACPAAFDGRQVTYVGELVGDLLHRDGGAWVLVNDDDYALEVGPLPSHQELRGANSGLSVWLPARLLPSVGGLGRPDRRGDVVELRGRVLRTDPADGGGLTLRADELRVLAPSSPVEHPLDASKLVLALVTMGLGTLLWLVRRRSERR